MKSLSSKIYSREYYLTSCLGYEEFKKYKGKRVHERIEAFADLLHIKKGMKVLDIGCGRGDLALAIARKGAFVVGIDYSRDGIALANEAIKHRPNAVRKRIKFLLMNAKKLQFDTDSFDIIVSFDVFEHLYKEELDMVMQEISRVLKPEGNLIVHTATNKIYLDYMHPLWVYPMNSLLISLNKYLTKHTYPGLDKDPRNEVHKKQHVNEPTYFYLRSLFKRFRFVGNINQIVPYKPSLSWKDNFYNVLVWFYPISKFLPFSILFACDYICVMKNKKN